MKKLLLGTALTLLAVSAQAQTGPKSYMMVVSSVAAGSIFSSISATITTIAPDGKENAQPVEFKRSSAKKAAESLQDVQVAALAKVNEYARQGWHLANSTSSVLTNTGNTIVYQNVYLLEK